MHISPLVMMMMMMAVVVVVVMGSIRSRPSGISVQYHRRTLAGDLGEASSVRKFWARVVFFTLQVSDMTARYRMFGTIDSLHSPTKHMDNF